MALDTGNLSDDTLYWALDRLYERGWLDKHKENDYDPRGTQEWQHTLDLFRAFRATLAAEVARLTGKNTTYRNDWIEQVQKTCAALKQRNDAEEKLAASEARVGELTTYFSWMDTLSGTEVHRLKIWAENNSCGLLEAVEADGQSHDFAGGELVAALSQPGKGG